MEHGRPVRLLLLDGVKLRSTPVLALLAVVAAVVPACASTGPEATGADAVVSTTAPTTTVVPTTAVTTTVPVTTVPETTVPETTVPETAVPTTALPTTSIATVVAVSESRVIGTSVNGTPITAIRRGAEGGRVVLVIGVIHGDEQAGLQVVERLQQLDVPTNVDLWTIDTMNPDGQAANERQNANQVDLNRNFPYKWGPIGQPGDGQYAGTGPSSEPETQAIVSLIDELRPDVVIWYHQDLNRIAPGKGRDGAIRARYAELTGLPIVDITGGTYTGVAATWARQAINPGVAFIVELGPTLSGTEADVHARAVLTIASEPG